MLTLLTVTAPWLTAADGDTRPWDSIPGVVLIGIAMGIGFLIVAIRAMFKKK